MDLLNSFYTLIYFEAIDSTAVTGSILLVDHVNLVATGPIMGQEFVKLKLRTPGMKGENGIIDFTKNVLVVTSMKTRDNIGNGQQGVLLEVASAELLKNERTKLNGSFVGTCSEIAKNIMRSKLDITKHLFVEPSEGAKKMVFPNIRPVHAILHAQETSYRKRWTKLSVYVLRGFEGFHFRSLASMYAANSVMQYTTSIPGSKPQNVFEDLSTILSHQIVGNGDTLVSQRLGAYGSNLTIYDTFAKKQTRQQFNYLDEFFGIPHANTIVDGKSGSSFPLVNSSPVEPTLASVIFLPNLF